jgi:hypothetical protein
MIDENFELDAIRAVAVVEREPDEARRAAARAQLTRLMDPHKPTRTSRRWSPRVPTWSLGLLSGVAAAVVAVVLVVGHGGAVQPASAAAALLRRAAAAPAMVSPAHLGPHQYWYVEDESAEGPRAELRTCGNDCYQTVVTRWWVGARRFSSHTYVIAKSAKPTTITRPAPNVPMKAARYSARWGGVGWGYDEIMRYPVMLHAPMAPSALRRLLERWGLQRGFKAPKGDPQWRRQLMFTNIQGILSEPRVPARMLSSLYRLLSVTTGVKFVGPVTDSLGRPTLAVAFRLAGARRTYAEYELMFDPSSYVLLDTRVAENDGRSRPVDYTAYDRSGLVRRIGALPKR